MILEIIVGVIVLIVIGYLVYLFGRLGKIIFQTKELGDGFGCLLVLVVLLFAVSVGSYFLGKFILGALGF